jgi:hypothetical protein
LTEHVINPFGDNPIITSRVALGEQCDVFADDLVRDRSRRSQLGRRPSGFSGSS